MYADWSYYNNTYKGSVIKTEEEYDFYGEMACDYVDAYIVQQIVKDTEQVKRCNCRIADIICSGAKKAGIASESIGGVYSVNFKDNDQQQIEAQINSALVLYLGRYVFGVARVTM